jgi:hypothetical protein
MIDFKIKKVKYFLLHSLINDKNQLKLFFFSSADKIWWNNKLHKIKQILSYCNIKLINPSIYL